MTTETIAAIEPREERQLAHEALARGYGVARRPVEANRHRQLAREAAEAIAEQEDRDLLEADLATLP